MIITEIRKISLRYFYQFTLIDKFMILVSGLNTSYEKHMIL